VVDGVILPEALLVKATMYPVHHEIGGDEKKAGLQPER
jgi:hypothetical protein